MEPSNPQLVDYEALAQRARTELSGLDLPADQQQLMDQLIDSYLELQTQDREMRWTSQWSGFSLKLPSIDTDTYNHFSRVADKLRKSPGRILSHLMEVALSREDLSISAKDLMVFKKYPTFDIQHMKELEVTANDLQEIPEGERVGFQHIKKLTLASDITPELFHSKIGYIQHCKTVQVPETFSPLALMSKAQFCKYFEFA